MSVVTMNPKNYFVLVGGKNIEGIKTMNLSFPNDDCDVEVDINGGITFTENPAGVIFELSLDLASEQPGNKILQIPANTKALTPVSIINAVTNIPVIFVDKSRVMITGWGKDDSGSDVPTNWKIKGGVSTVIM